VSWSEGNYSVTDSVGPRGEIHVGGAHVAAGYYNMPDKTAEEFYEQDGRRWFKTGDIGHVMSDGSFKIIDRKKDLVKLQMGKTKG
jgi:long-chain acyl-CoA synthetase